MPRMILAGILAVAVSSASAMDPDDYRMVDLSHAYGEDTLYWPTSPSAFEKKELAYGETEGGWFYSAYSICTPEHGGTHLDAPLHFSADGLPNDEIPIANLIAPAVVIDVSEQASQDRNYRVTVEDVTRFEERHGRIRPGTIVLARTGWSRYWPDALDYLGDDTPGSAENLEFPGYGADAARLLAAEREVALLGIDTASIDHGRSQDFAVHRIVAEHDVGGLENLTNLNQLPPAGFVVVALPMKIEGGSGGPVRVVALVRK